MRSWFYKKGYPKNLLEKEMNKFKFSVFTRRSRRGKKSVSFVLPYHPNLKT